MRRNFPVRVVAAYFVPDINPRNLHLTHAFSRIGIQLPTNVDETALLFTDHPLRDVFRRHVEHRRQIRNLRFRRILRLIGHRPNAAGRNRGRKHHAVAIHDLSALCGHGERPGIAGFPLLLQKFGINAALQPESFSDHGRHAEEKETEEQTAAARRNGFHEHRFFAAVGVTLFWGGVFPPQQSSAVQPATQTLRHHLCTSKCCCVSSSGATSTNTVSESSAGAYPNCRARAFTAAGSAARLRSSDN